MAWSYAGPVNPAAHCEAGRLDRNGGASRHGVDEGFGARVPTRQQDQLCRQRFAQWRQPTGHARTTAMPRATADVDADHRAPCLRRAGATRDEHDVGRIGVHLRRDAT